MPTLNWIGKDKIQKHHHEVAFRALEHKYGFNAQGQQEEPVDSENMIIHGDNLAALKSLLLTSSLKKHTFYNLLINNILYLCVT